MKSNFLKMILNNREMCEFSDNMSRNLKELKFLAQG